LDQITTHRVDQVIANWRRDGLGGKRINNLLTVLRRCLRTAEEWGLIRATPRIRSLRVEIPVPVFLSPEETVRLLAAFPTGFWRTLALFIATTGVRFGEAAALQWTDLHLDAEHPYVFVHRAVESGDVGATKTVAGRRTIPLIPQTVDALRRHDRVSDWVFPSTTGRFLRPNHSSIHLTRACTDAGLQRITWHKLRHTTASTLMAKGVPPAVVRDILGHTSIEMTMRYTHVSPQVARACVQALSNPQWHPVSPRSGHQVATKVPASSRLQLATT
jgi:integrase